MACRRSCAARSEAQGVLAQIYGCEGEIVFGNIYRRAKVPDAAVSSGWPGVRALLRLRFASPEDETQLRRRGARPGADL